MGSFILVFLLYYPIKAKLPTIGFSAKFEPELNPTNIMIDFEKAAMNSFENNFPAVISGCFFIFHKIFTERFNPRD